MTDLLEFEKKSRIADSANSKTRFPETFDGYTKTEGNSEGRLIPHHYIKNNNFPTCCLVTVPQPHHKELFQSRIEYANRSLPRPAYKMDSLGQIFVAGRRTPWAIVNAECKVTRVWAAGDGLVRLAPSMKYREAPPDWESGIGLFLFPEMEIRLFMGYTKNLYQEPVDWQDDRWYTNPNPDVQPVFWGVVDMITVKGSSSGVFYEVVFRDKMRYFVDTVLHSPISIATRQHEDTDGKGYLSRGMFLQNIIDQTFFTPGVFRQEPVVGDEFAYDRNQAAHRRTSVMSSYNSPHSSVSPVKAQFPCDTEYDLEITGIFGGPDQTRKPFVMDYACYDSISLVDKDVFPHLNRVEDGGSTQSEEQKLKLQQDFMFGDCSVMKTQLENSKPPFDESANRLKAVMDLLIKRSRTSDDARRGLKSGFYDIEVGDDDPEVKTFFDSQASGNNLTAFFFDSRREQMPAVVAAPQSSDTPHGLNVVTLINSNVEGQPPIDVIRYLANSELWPTEVFVDHRTGHFFYIPRSTHFRRDGMPSRVYVIGRPVEINNKIYPPNVHEWQMEWSTLGYKNNFHVMSVGSSSGGSELPLHYYFSLVESPGGRILPSYIAPRHVRIADPTASLDSTGAKNALVTALSMARALSRDIRVGTIVVDGDPKLLPGHSCWIFNAGLFNVDSLQMTAEEYTRSITPSALSEYMNNAYKCYRDNALGQTSNRQYFGVPASMTIANDANKTVSSSIVEDDKATEFDKLVGNEPLYRGSNQTRQTGIILRVDTVQHVFCINLRKGYQTEILLGELM